MNAVDRQRCGWNVMTDVRYQRESLEGIHVIHTQRLRDSERERERERDGESERERELSQVDQVTVQFCT